jgi:hypothetical protein
MGQNIISNNAVSERYDYQKQVERLLPVGRMYFETYRHVRVDRQTIKLIKPKKDEAEDETSI